MYEMHIAMTEWHFIFNKKKCRKKRKKCRKKEKKCRKNKL